MQAIEALLNKLESAGVSNPYSTPIASIQASMQQPALHIHAGWTDIPWSQSSLPLY